MAFLRSLRYSSVALAVLCTQCGSNNQDSRTPELAEENSPSATSLLEKNSGIRENDNPGSASVASDQPSAAVQDELVLAAPWGDGPGAIGRSSGQEAALLGPSSFVVGARGVVFVLDGQNARILRFEKGAAVASIPLPDRPFEDLVLADGGFALLDLYQQPALVFIGTDGSIRSEVSLTNRPLEPRALAGLHRSVDGFWVDVEGVYSVKVADASGAPVTATAMPGLAATRGSLRGVSGGTKIKLWRSSDDATQALATVEFNATVWGQSMLATLSDGRIVLTAYLAQPPTGPEMAVGGLSHVLVVLSAVGRELRRKELPVATGYEEVYRSVRVGDDNAVYLLLPNVEGVKLVRVVP